MAKINPVLVDDDSVLKQKALTHVDGAKCAVGIKCDYCDEGGYSTPMPGPTSLEALATARAAQAQVSAIQSATYDFGDVVRNIAASPTIDDKAAAIAAEAGVFQQMMAALSNGVTDALKALGFSKAGARHSKTDNEAIQSVHDMAVKLGAMCEAGKSAFGVFKGLDGNYYGLGVVTNCYEDLEGEIIRDAAHKEFVAYLDANPTQAPELWTWHTPGTARKSRAIWWDYTDNGFFWRLYPLTPAEAKALEPITPCAMSHQFNGIKEGNEWAYYRTFEDSVLPVGAEANPYTSFDVVAKEYLTMGFTPDKRAFLEQIHGPEQTKELEQREDKARKALDAMGAKRKENEATPAPDTATTTTPVVHVGDATPTVEQSLATLTTSMIALTEKFTALEGEVKALKSAKQKEITTEAERLTAQTMQRLTSPRGPTVGIAEAAKAQGEALTPEQMKAAGVVDAVTVAAGWENAQIRRG